MKLKNKVAIVTGAGGGGVGRAVARRFAREGAAVIVNDVNLSGGRETLAMIRFEGGRGEFVRADMGVEEEARAVIVAAESHFDGLDILVNNASGGVNVGPFEAWQEAVQTDLLGPMYATLAAMEPMRRRGGGAIVNIASTSALGHGAMHSPWPGYDVAKMGVMRLTTTLARLREDRIRVNCLVPGWVASPGPKEYWESLTPQQRRERGVPETLLQLGEIADEILHLATDESLFGRLMVWRNGEKPRLIAEGDPGYARLE